MLPRSRYICDRNLKWYKIDRNLPFFGGGSSPEFLDLDYKIQPVSDHVAKFHGDRSRDLGESVAKKNICGKT